MKFRFYILIFGIYNSFFKTLQIFWQKHAFLAFCVVDHIFKIFIPIFCEKHAFLPIFYSKCGVVIITKNYNADKKEKEEDEEERKLHEDRGGLKVVNDNRIVKYNYLLIEKSTE